MKRLVGNRRSPPLEPGETGLSPASSGIRWQAWAHTKCAHLDPEAGASWSRFRLSIEIPRGQSGRQQPVHRAKAEGGAIPGKPRPHRKKYAFALRVIAGHTRTSRISSARVPPAARHLVGTCRREPRHSRRRGHLRTSLALVTRGRRQGRISLAGREGVCYLWCRSLKTC